MDPLAAPHRLPPPPAYFHETAARELLDRGLPLSDVLEVAMTPRTPRAATPRSGPGSKPSTPRPVIRGSRAQMATYKDLTPHEEKAVVAAFHKLDTHKSGKLEVHSFFQLCQSLDIHLNSRLAREWLGSLNQVDGLSLDQVKSICARILAAARHSVTRFFLPGQQRWEGAVREARQWPQPEQRSRHCSKSRAQWCLFELAAFLKSKTSQQQHLIVRPIFMGPLSIAVFLTFAAVAMAIATVPIRDEDKHFAQLLSAIVFCGFVVAVPTASTIRSYFRDLDTMKLQLSSISVDSTRSSCCDRHHVRASGGRMFCDRKIVKECVKIWFGSELSFEDTVRAEVLDILNRNLTQKVFSTPWALGVTSPIMLAFMDVSASWAQHYWVPWEHPAIALLLEGLVIWFIFVPANKDLLILLLRTWPEGTVTPAWLVIPRPSQTRSEDSILDLQVPCERQGSGPSQSSGHGTAASPGHSGDSRASDTDLHMEAMIPTLVESVAKMEVVNPEVLRVTPVFRALEHFAAALRAGSAVDFYHKSHRSQRISTFWSHSWHGGHWKKIFAIITLYNGTAAVLLSLLTGACMMWCLFELAAFLKSKTSQQQHLIVRPIFMGPLSIAIFLTFAALAIPVATVPVDNERTIVQLLSPIVFCTCVVAVPAASTVRSYFRDLDTMKLQLLSISVDSTRSSCCDLHHVGPSGERMMCDRKIVKECVKIWFGSEVTFEDTVRTNVLDILNRDLTQKVFSTPWALGVTSPIMLAFMDVSASWAQHYWVPWEHPAIALLLEGLVIWFIFVPANKDLLILLLRWCLFELAAFLKSKTSQQQHLIVRPIFMGPLSIAVFLTFAALAMPIATVPVDNERTIVQLLSPIVFCACVVAVPAASTVRSYFRDLDTMKLQLLSISVDSTRSSCCDLHHVSPSGEHMMCDRKIVKECVKIWFGSELSFEDTVRTNVLDILNRDLTQKVFSTPWALGVTSPIMLAFMDVSASWTPDSNWNLWEHPSVALLLEGLAIWLLFVPADKDFFILLLRLGRQKPKSTCLELLKNLAVLAAAAVPVLVMVVAYGPTRFADEAVFGTANAMLRAVAFAFCTLLISLCIFLIGLGLNASQDLNLTGGCPTFEVSWPPAHLNSSE
ncbi:unnamed protein product, partial [Symbiodinium microadriaticum]